MKNDYEQDNAYEHKISRSLAKRVEVQREILAGDILEIEEREKGS